MFKVNKVILENEAGEKVNLKKGHPEIRFTDSQIDFLIDLINEINNSSIKVAKDVKEINILKICN